jgi:hypothetical protein
LRKKWDPNVLVSYAKQNEWREKIETLVRELQAVVDQQDTRVATFIPRGENQ